MRTLDNQRILQVWQWDSATQAERTIGDAIELAKPFGATGLAVKALDGDSWMRSIEERDHPDDLGDALGSLDDVRHQADACHAASLSYYVWVNVLGRNLELEAVRTADLALVEGVDGVILDVEPYAGHWGAWRSVGLARAYLDRVRQIAPAAYLVLQPDPRPARLAEIRIEEWLAGGVDAVAGQHYFGAFETDPAAEMTEARHRAAELAKPYYPTLSVGGVSPDELKRTVVSMEVAGFRGAILWRMGAATRGHLEAFGSFSPQFPPGPPGDQNGGMARTVLLPRIRQLKRDIAELEEVVRSL